MTPWPLSLCVLAILALGCGRLSNRFSEVKLDCGADARASGTYLQILDPRGRPMTPSQLLIRSLAKTGEESLVPATSKGCVELSAEQRTLIATSSLADFPWGAIVKTSNLPATRKVRMSDISQTRLSVECPSKAFVKEALQSPLRVPTGAEAFPYRMRIVQDQIQVDVDEMLNLNGELKMPGVLNDGPFSLMIDNQNLFQSDSTKLQQPPLICDYVLDRQAPEPHDSFSEAFAHNLFKALPGETVTLSLSDANAASLHYCLKAGDQACEDEDDYVKAGVEVSLQAPTSGYWCLRYYGLDLAGNRSETHERCALSYQATLIENIRELSDAALLRLSSDPLIATGLMLKALYRYTQLPTAEEKAALSDKLLANLLTLGSAVKERNRIQLTEFPKKTVKIGDKVLVHDSVGLRLLEPKSLQLLQSLPFPEAEAIIVRDSRALVKTSGGFVYYRLADGKLVEKGRFTWPDGLNRDGIYDIHPVLDEFVHVGGDGAFSVIHLDNGAFTPKTLFTLPGGERLTWSKDGDSVLIEASDLFSLVQRTRDGSYSFDQTTDFIESSPFGSAYVDSIKGFVIVSNAGLHIWKDGAFASLPNALIDENIAELAINYGFRNRLLAVREGRVLFAGKRALIQIDPTNAVIPVSPFVSPIPISVENLRYWSYDGDRLSILDSATLNTFTYRTPENVWTLEQRIPNLSLVNPTILSFPAVDRTVIEDSLKISTWSKHTAYGSFFAGNSDIGFMRFMKTEQGPRIATGSYVGSARLWGLDGAVDRVFHHNSKSLVQVNELAWNSKQSRFVTVGEDGRAVVYDDSGHALDELDEAAQCPESKIRLRYTALFAPDDETLVTSGQTALNSWTLGSDGYDPLACCISLGARVRDIRNLPGDLHFLRWQGRDILLSAPSFHAGDKIINIFEMDGKPANVWQKNGTRFSAAALDAKNESLALATADGLLQIYQWSNEGLVMRAQWLSPGGTAPIKLSWKPDSKVLAAFYPKQSIRLFHFENNTLALDAERALALDGNSTYFQPLWVGDDLYYSDKGVLYRVDEDLQLLGKVSPFLTSTLLPALDYDAATNRIAVQKEGEVRLLPLDLQEARRELCREFTDYLKLSSDFTNSDELTSVDRLSCPAE
jgi:hypothetical protein